MLGLRNDLATLAATPLLLTKTGQTPRRTRNRRPVSDPPRTAGRFAKGVSLGTILNRSLTSSEACCLVFLLAQKRDGNCIYNISAGSIASQFGVTNRTVSRWLKKLSETDYLKIRPGRLQGQLVLELCRKATRWRQFSKADLSPQKRNGRPNGPLWRRPATNLPTYKEEKKERNKDAQEVERLEAAKPAAPLTEVETQAELLHLKHHLPTLLAKAHQELKDAKTRHEQWELQARIANLETALRNINPLKKPERSMRKTLLVQRLTRSMHPAWR
jgi:DNA-binding transcriptional ArsR family regulator